MTRVCHITSAHKRYDGRIFQRECVSLSEQGYDVTLLVNDTEKAEFKDGVSICSINKEYQGRLGRINAVKHILKKALEIDAEIYQLHDPELLLIAKQLKRAGKKVIFDSHEFYSEQIRIKNYIPHCLRNIIANIYFRYETGVFKSIDGVISAGSIMVDGKPFDPFSSRCQNVISLGNYPRVIKRDLSNIKKPEFKVCYVGGLTHERGITTLIDACYKAGCKLILAGEFSSEMYHNKLKEKPSYACVEYRGICNKQQVYDIYEETTVGAATLLNIGQYYKVNGFATKVIEYFQMKLPVIISNYPYAVDMNNKYHFGICVEPDDEEAIADAIKAIKNDNQLKMDLGENGYRLYKEQFNWEQEEQKLIDFYKKI